MDGAIAPDGTASPSVRCTCPAPHEDPKAPSEQSSFSAPALARPKTFDEHLHEVGIRVLQSLQGFLAIIITISIFGASIFSSLISQLEQPPYPRFSLQTIRNFMAISWLLFVVALGAATFSAVQLNAVDAGAAAAGEGGEKSAERSTKRVPRWKTRTALLAHFFTEMLILGAFFFLSLVVVAYAEPVGWVAVALSIFSVVGVGALWIHRIFEPKIFVSDFTM